MSVRVGRKWLRGRPALRILACQARFCRLSKSALPTASATPLSAPPPPQLPLHKISSPVRRVSGVLNLSTLVFLFFPILAFIYPSGTFP
ncbi:hypothetical protein K432DRAFT_82405 [Lepidopterella palustris CBS 459.81]|uniref:Uncharacterized protein n=1 Tax=Lepidopterella palustris CBS 459.81 TaxID=1314670 RepID=A0A8E2JJQ2_9PEZI|nr:hypothetical protein K432DRAFT_82405 [Lepidopterella palustris CBS 459.81]